MFCYCYCSHKSPPIVPLLELNPFTPFQPICLNTRNTKYYVSEVTELFYGVLVHTSSRFRKMANVLVIENNGADRNGD